MDSYKIIVDVQGAPSGSDKLAQQQGEILPESKETVKRTKQKKESSLLDALEQKIGKEKFDTTKKAATVVTAVGYVALDLYQQDRAFRGDSNRNLRINETKKKAAFLGVTAGLLATGNIPAAALYVAYTALNFAKENRELLNARKVDAYKSRYYQDRLVQDLTKRSR